MEWTMDGRFLDLSDLGGKSVLVAMSGGVDSSVAALLLKTAGLRVTGLTMKNYCYGDAEVPDRSCCSLEAIDDARRECTRLGITHRVADVEELFAREVIGDFLSEYENARTPNPCVRCNSIVRFRTLIDHADRLGIDFVATGHYARVLETRSGRRYLARAIHRDKDQSYFLSGVHGGTLGRLLFPLGEYDKETVRRLAVNAGMPVAAKDESQEVCFVPEGTLESFLAASRVSFTPGRIESVGGEVIGTHSGLAPYTVGQRRGLGLATGAPQYVVRLDHERNVLVVGGADDLLSRHLLCRVAWIDEGAFGDPAAITAQIRYRHAAAAVEKIDINGSKARIDFAEPQRAICPGQTVALYREETVVGSGVIDGSGDG
jgi:tRNA-specific 2-thiouridylase